MARHNIETIAAWILVLAIHRAQLTPFVVCRNSESSEIAKYLPHNFFLINCHLFKNKWQFSDRHVSSSRVSVCLLVPCFGHVITNAIYVFVYTIPRYSNSTKEHLTPRTHILASIQGICKRPTYRFEDIILWERSFLIWNQYWLRSDIVHQRFLFISLPIFKLSLQFPWIDSRFNINWTIVL